MTSPKRKRKRKTKAEMIALRKALKRAKCPPGQKKLLKPIKQGNGWRFCSVRKRKSPSKKKRKRRTKAQVAADKAAHRSAKCPAGTKKLKNPAKKPSGGWRHCTKKRKSPRKKSGSKRKRKRRTKAQIAADKAAHRAAKCPAGVKKLKNPVKKPSGGWRHCAKKRKRKSKRKSPRKSKRKSKRKSPRKSKKFPTFKHSPGAARRMFPHLYKKKSCKKGKTRRGSPSGYCRKSPRK